MDNSKEEYKEWDEIFKEREEYLKQHPEGRNLKRPKKFEDEDGDVRCTKCGSTREIGDCPDCKQERGFLKENNR